MIRRNPVAFAVICFLLTAALGILLRPLTPIDETRYLAVAWEMHLSGDWLVPSKNFAPYSDKPPLLFWAINLVWLVTGVSEFAARMVGPLFCGAAIWLTAILARRLWPDDRDVGGRAALALAGLSIFVVAGSLTMFDAPLAVAVLIGLISLHSAAGHAEAGRFGFRPWAGFGAALALGVLTKGPVILFHLLPAALLLPIWSADRLPWRGLPLRLGFGLAVGLALVALWLVPAAITGGEEYRAAILWHQSAGRLTESFAHARPWWFFLAILPLMAFPLAWTPTLWRAAGKARWRTDPGLRLCLIWTGSALLLFSLTSGKQVHYLVPELPALALIAARLLRDSPLFEPLSARSQPAAQLNFMPAVLALGALAAIAALAGIGALPLGDLAPLFTPRSALLAWALLIIALCWLVVLKPHLPGAMLLSLGGLLATNILIGVSDIATIYSTHPTAAAISRERPDGLAYVGATYHAEFNFAARLTQPVATPADNEELARWIADHPDGLVLGRRGTVEPSWTPQETISFRGRDLGLWRVADAPNPLRSDE